MPRLLLVDGSNYLYRAHYAMPDFTNSQQMHTGALFGLVNMLRKLKEDYPSDYTACIFDAKGPTFRHVLYTEYKANRGSMPEELREQMSYIPNLISALGWTYLSIEGVEADDIIGTLAKQASQHNLDVLIATGDKDMAQLVEPRIHLVDTLNNRYLDIEGVLGRFDVYPEQIIDYLTLIGDTSDNIPGVAKVGPKTAAKWLKTYQTLDNLLLNKEAIKGVVGENLRQAVEWLPATKRLISIHVDCHDYIEQALPNWQTWHVFADKQESYNELAHLFKTLEFKGFAKQLDYDHQKQKRVLDDTIEHINDENSINTQENNDSTLTYLNFLQHLKQTQVLQGIDAISQLNQHLNTFLLGIDKSFNQIINIALNINCKNDVLHIYVVGMQISLCLKLQNTLELKSKLYQQLMHFQQTHPYLIFCMYDAKECLNHFKIEQSEQISYLNENFLNIDDIGMMNYVFKSDSNKGLDDLARTHLQYESQRYQSIFQEQKEQLLDKNAQLKTDLNLEDSDLISLEDAWLTYHLHQYYLNMFNLPENVELKNLYQYLDKPCLQSIITMERQGILLDSLFLQKQSLDVSGQLEILEQTIYALAGQSFNLYSPKQIGQVFFETLGMPVLKRTAQKTASTDEEVLHKLAQTYPIAQHLLEHRALAKLKNTYIDKLPTMAKQNRLHTQFNLMGTVSGRLSSSEPNLQNIPVKTAQGRKIRQAFIAKAGYCLVSFDYSQIELRILAHFSQDSTLKQAFIDGKDIHAATAAQIFNKQLNDVTNDDRRYAKSINFGLMYGMSAFGLSNQLSIDMSEAKTYIERYFAQFASVEAYLNTVKKQASMQGYVETLFKRRVYINQINHSMYTKRQAAERLAINAPMQGSAADIIRLAMCVLDRHLMQEKLNSKMVLQIHDELVFEVPFNELKHMQEVVLPIFSNILEHAVWLKNDMQHESILTVPLIANIGIGDNWNEAHD